MLSSSIVHHHNHLSSWILSILQQYDTSKFTQNAIVPIKMLWHLPLSVDSHTCFISLSCMFFDLHFTSKASYCQYQVSSSFAFQHHFIISINSLPKDSVFSQKPQQENKFLCWKYQGLSNLSRKILFLVYQHQFLQYRIKHWSCS